MTSVVFLNLSCREIFVSFEGPSSTHFTLTCFRTLQATESHCSTRRAVWRHLHCTGKKLHGVDSVCCCSCAGDTNIWSISCCAPFGFVIFFFFFLTSEFPNSSLRLWSSLFLLCEDKCVSVRKFNINALKLCEIFGNAIQLLSVLMQCISVQCIMGPKSFNVRCFVSQLIQGHSSG